MELQSSCKFMDEQVQMRLVVKTVLCYILNKALSLYLIKQMGSKRDNFLLVLFGWLNGAATHLPHGVTIASALQNREKLWDSSWKAQLLK